MQKHRKTLKEVKFQPRAGQGKRFQESQVQEQEQEKKGDCPRTRGASWRKERGSEKMVAWQGSRAGAMAIPVPSPSIGVALAHFVFWRHGCGPPQSTNANPTLGGWQERSGKKQNDSMRAAVSGRGARCSSHGHGTASRAWRGIAEWPAPDIDLQWRHVGMGLDSTAAIRRRHHGHGPRHGEPMCLSRQDQAAEVGVGVRQAV